MIRPTDSELQAAAADPNGRRLCVFCHAQKVGYNGTPTCSHYCWSNEYATLIQITSTRRAADGDHAPGRGWLTV